MNDAFRRQFQRVLPLCGSYGRASNDGETVAAGQPGTTTAAEGETVAAGQPGTTTAAEGETVAAGQPGTTTAAEGKTVAAGRPGTTTAAPLTAMQTVKTVAASDKPTTPPDSKPY